MSNGGPEGADTRVLVLAPTARDAAASRDLLSTAGVHCHLCATIADVCREAGSGAGAALVTAEAVVGDADGRLARMLRSQPPWSDLPLIVLTPPGNDSPRLLRALEAVGPMTLMKRPVQVSSLISTVRAALRDRRRQYSVRDFMAERERSRVTLSSIGDAVIATDTQGRVTFLNGVAEAMTGWPQAEAAGRPLPDVFHIVNAHTQRPVENPALRALREGRVIGLANHTLLIARDGTERPIDDSAAPIRTEAGATSGAVLVFRDVTARKRAEEAVRASEDRYRTLFTSIDQGFCVIEVLFEGGRATDYRFIEANPVFERQTGLAGAVGRTARELVPGLEERWVEFYGRVATTGEASRFVEGSAAMGRWFDVFASRTGGPESRTVAILFTDVTDRKRAEAERERLLREVEAERGRLADVFQRAPSFMCVLRGPDHVYERANDRYFELLGRRDIIGRTVRQVLPEVEGQGFFEILDGVYRTGEPFVGTDVRVTLMRGGRMEERVLEFVYQPVRDAAGAVSGVLAHGIDLTERVRAEAERVALTESLSLALGAAELGTWDWDPGTDRVTLSARAAEMYGLAPGRTYAREWMRGLIRPDYRDRARETAARAATGRAEYDLEYPLDRGGWVAARGRGLYDAAGNLTRMLGVVQDVTARKRSEAALRQSEERHRVLVTATSDVVYRMSADWAVMDPIDGRGLVPSASEPKRDWMHIILPAFEHPRVWDAIHRAIDGKRTFELEHQVNRADGTLGWTFSRAVPTLDAAGNIAEWFGMARDVTERKEAEEALREADRKKDDFIALLAHELRNPLAPIRNALQILRLSDDRATREQSQAVMGRQLAHMVRMIDDLLDVSRIGRQKMDLRRARVALADVIGSAVETARPAIEDAGHELTVSLPPGPVFLDADLTRLSQVFSNLLTNSAKYTEPGGRIWLAAEPTAGGVRVSVRDTGIGLPADALRHIFDMFSQVDRPTERTTGGLGIGLALVKGLVEMHGGTVAVESEGQGRGSTFTVTMPTLAETPVTPAAPTGGSDPPGAARRILVADDNRDGAASLAEMLRLMGHEVRTAHDGLEAVEQAEGFRPEVILMDVGMPQLDGLAATRRIREQPWGRGMRIIALTGWGQEADREKSREAGCDDHLVKPAGPPDLERLLAESKR